MKTLDIVIPIYRSKLTLEALVDRLNEWIRSGRNNLNIRVIFVEDASGDGTYEFLLKLKDRIQFKFEAIRLMRNYGQHTAISVGLSASSADLVAVMDDDLQHDPFEIDLLIDELEERGLDLVYGVYKEKQHNFARNFASRVLKRITKSKTVDFSNVTSFKVMKSSVLTTLKYQSSPVIFVDVYLLESAGKVGTCQVNHAKRAAGISTYSNRKLMKLTVGILLFHSSMPLKWIVRIGFAMSVVFFGLSCYYIYQKLVNDAAVGFTSIIVAIFLSTGLILVSLGIIGEYIRRIWINQNNLERVIIAEKQEA